MNTIQIDEILRNNPVTKNEYIGCLASDQLSNIKKHIKNKCFFITNTLSSGEKGMGHWLLFYVDYNDVLFFDSFGFKPENYNNIYITNFVRSYNPKNVFIALTYPIQSASSLLCGAYCLYVGYHLCKNIPIERILTKFNKYSRVSNDRKVEQFLEEMTGTITECNAFMCPTMTFKETCKSICNCL